MAGARCWGRPAAPGASAHLLRFGIGLSRFEKRLRGRGLDLSERRGGTPLELTSPTSVSSRHTPVHFLLERRLLQRKCGCRQTAGGCAALGS